MQILTEVLALFLSVAAEGVASTQVSHDNTVKKSVQASASVTSTATGPNERSCAFLGYNSLIQRKDAFRELCGVNAKVFSMLLSVLFIHCCERGGCANFPEVVNILDEDETRGFIRQHCSAFWPPSHNS